MRILIAQARSAASGGAEAYLRDLAKVLLDEGCAVGHIDIDGHQPPGASGRGRPLGRTGRHLWNWARVCRRLPEISRGYDRVILGYGEGPALDCPTLTVHHAPALFNTDPALNGYLGGQATAVRLAYTRACNAIARPATDAGETITNSQWTARMMSDHCNEQAMGWLYPKINFEPRPMDHAPRKPYAIVSLGRIVPNKRFEDAIRFTDRLRCAGIPAELDIIGRAENPAYLHRLTEMTRQRPYVRINLDPPDSERNRILAQASLGFHGLKAEHFGMGVAEMILAGVVTFVFDAGGVCELVTDPGLRFQTVTEAADRAMSLICRPDLRERSQRELQTGAALSQARNFESCARDILMDWTNGKLRDAA